MEYVVEVVSPVEKRVTATIPAAVVEARVNTRLRKLAPTARVDGFRPGRAPVALVRARYGATATEDAVNILVDETVTNTLSSVEFESGVFITRPEVSRSAEGGDLIVVFTVEFMPVIEDVQYKGLPLESLRVTVTDADVDERVSALRVAHSVLLPVEDRTVVQPGDVVVVSYRGVGDESPSARAENALVDLGDPAEAAFAEALVGAEVGVPRVAKHRAHPDDPQGVPPGTEVEIEATVSAIQLRELPELTDAFVAEHGAAPTIEAFGEAARAELRERRTKAEEARLREAAVAALAAANPVPIPAGRVFQIALSQAREQVDRALHEKDEDWRARVARVLAPGIAPAVERALRELHLLEAVAKAEEITVTEEEMEAELRAEATVRRIPLARVRAQYASEAARAEVSGRLRRKRAHDALVAHASVTVVDALTPVAQPPEE